MAVKDGEKYLRRAIDSILAQTFSDFEFIIINDGSTDATIDIINESSDPRIVFLSNQSSLGLSRSLNLGLEMARGEYVARMDADDISLPHRLDKQVRFMDEHPGVIVLGTGFSFIDVNGSHMADCQFPFEHELIVWALPFYNPVAHPTVMMRTFAIKELGGYDTAFRSAQDYDLWFRVASRGKIANLQEICVYLRQHQGQVSRAHSNDQLDCALSIAEKYIISTLHKRVSRDVLEKIWTFNLSTVEDAVLAGGFVWNWYRHNFSKVRSASIRLIIMTDASNRIRAAISPHFGKLRVLFLTICLYVLEKHKKILRSYMGYSLI